MTTPTASPSPARRLITAGATALALTLTGCSAPADPERECLPVALPQAAQALIMIVGTHAGTPAPNVPGTAAPLLQATLAAGNPVRVIALDGTPALLELPATRPVSRNTCDGFATTLAGATNAVIGAVKAAAADSDGNDMYSSLDLAGKIAHANGWNNATILVIDSGLAERPRSPINFAQPGMTTADAEQVSTFALASQPLDLSGLTVDFQGLGQTAPPQLPLSPAEQIVVAEIWPGIATKAGAADVRVTPVPRTGPGPDTPYVTALTPVAAVDIFTPPTPTAPTTLTLGEADVHFASNKADLTDPAAAEKRLAPVVAWLAADPTHKVTLYGRTDSAGGHDYNLDLGTRRAETVKASILRADPDINHDQITTVGQGYDFEGFIPDKRPDGSLDPVKASKNRHVLVLATTT